MSRTRSLFVLALLAVALGGCSSTTPPSMGPHLTFGAFPAASVVIGQPNFTSEAYALTASGLGYVYGNPALVNGRLYLPDYDNNRVLGFPGGIPTTNGASAGFVLGQPNFTTGSSGTSSTDMDGAQTITVAGGKMFIVQYGGNRVLGYNSIPTSTHAAADFVLGQPGFGSDAATCTASGMDSPESAFAHGDKLLVADTSGDRILIYNSLPSSSGAAADIVLGQGDFTHCVGNDDNQDNAVDAAPTARTLSDPSDVWTDGTRVVVADAKNNRVLVWTSFPTSNFQPADIVIGQSSMTTAVAAAGPKGMDYPYFLTSKNKQLFVADADNNRVLIFNSIPTANGAAADAVLGQSNFTNYAPNDANQNGVPDGTPSARTFDFPAGLLVTDDALIVADDNNDRYLVFRP